MKILKAARRILLSILFTVALGRLFTCFPSLSASLCLCLWHCMPRGTSTRAANLLPILASCCTHPTQVNLSLLLPAQFHLLFLLAGRVSKLPNFFAFFGFLPLFFLLPAASYPVEAINVLSCQRSAAAVGNCYGQKRNSRGNNNNKSSK